VGRDRGGEGKPIYPDGTDERDIALRWCELIRGSGRRL
jgi:hypothetical protein